MNVPHCGRRVSLVLFSVVVVASVVLQAQAARAQFQPQVGQAGKDVVWVPTPQTVVDTMLNMAKVTPQDYVMDLGSGDGRTVITAAKRGATAQGIEFNPDMVELSRGNAAKEGVTARATFTRGDLFQADLSKATVITMFLLPDINLKLRPKLLDLKPGTRIVSNSFTMGEWAADATQTVDEDCTSWCTALLWIIPAKVDGAWKLPTGELTLKQSFQMLSGAIKTGSTSASITAGKMMGDQITFTAGGAEYTGRVNGNTIEGTVNAKGSKSSWTATRAGK
jgi:precorrin-6B methylase 2